MSKINTSPPSGFPEFSPKFEIVRQNWIRTITSVFEKNGFLPTETPIIERAENLVAKGGNPKEIYVLDRLLNEEVGNKKNALRFDHTVPLALFVARHQNEITFPFRRYAIGPVFRGERAQKGRFRQFDQCDIDVIGSEDLPIFYDAEVASIAIQIFCKLFPNNDFFVRINNRKILTEFFASLGVADTQIMRVIKIIDDLEKLSRDKILARFAEEKIEQEVAEKILKFTEISGTNAEILKKLKTVSDDSDFQVAVAELEIVIQTLENMEIAEKYFRIDLKIARGLDYYTGTVFETTLVGHEDLGSICSGGRYEDLASVFTNKKMPGVGISIGLSRLLSQLFAEQIIKPEKSSPTEVLIFSAEQDFNNLKIARTIYSAAKILKEGNDRKSFSTQIYFEPKKISKKFEYAEKIGAQFCAIVGTDEAEKGMITIKNLKSGEQATVKIEKIFDEVNKRRYVGAY
jgi:histidyl-tRNA synthetase